MYIHFIRPILFIIKDGGSIFIYIGVFFRGRLSYIYNIFIRSRGGRGAVEGRWERELVVVADDL